MGILYIHIQIHNILIIVLALIFYFFCFNFHFICKRLSGCSLVFVCFFSLDIFSPLVY